MKPFKLSYLRNYSIINCDMFTHESEIACNFNCLVESEGLLKVTASHVHCKCGNISETMRDSNVDTTDH